MADNVLVTPGSGANVRAKNIAGVLTQCVQVDLGGESAEFLLIADATYGVPVDIKRFPAGAVLVNNPTAANLKVDASGATVPVSSASALTVIAAKTAPVAVRIADGTNFIDTLPISGGVTAAQGTAALVAAAWPIKVTDGTNTAAVDASSGGLQVAVVAGGGGGIALADLAAFTQGTTDTNPIGGLYATSLSDPSAGQVAQVQITQKRALHINLRAAAGTEVGTSGAPLRMDPTGTTPQPVTLSYTAAAPLFTAHGGRAFTRVTKSVAITASQTGSTVWTPTSGKAFYITKAVIALSVAGTLTLFDGTNAAANLVTDGAMPIGYFAINFDEPWAAAAVNDVLKYTSGSSITGTLTVHGFEA